MKTKRNIASILFVAFATLGFMASCTGNEKKIVSGNYTLTLDGLEYKEEKLTDEFCDFTLIPLETREECIMSQIPKIIATEKGFYIFNRKPVPFVFLMNNDGTFNRTIGALGHANNEYQFIMNISADEKGDTIVILDMHELKFYDSDNNFLFSKSLDGTNGIEDMAITPNGYFMGMFHRQQDDGYMILGYDKNFEKKSMCIEKGHTIIKGPLGNVNLNYIQKDHSAICCLDIPSSTFYVFDANNTSEIGSYTLSSDLMWTEEMVNNNEITDKNENIRSYIFARDCIRGHIHNWKGNYDFRIDLNSNEITLIHHDLLDYNFDCYNNGYFYKLMTPRELLRIIEYDGVSGDDGYKEYMMNMREMLKDTLEPIKDSIKENDNPYLLRMRLKKN